MRVTVTSLNVALEPTSSGQYRSHFLLESKVNQSHSSAAQRSGTHTGRHERHAPFTQTHTYTYTRTHTRARAPNHFTYLQPAILFDVCDHDNDGAVDSPHHSPKVPDGVGQRALCCNVRVTGLTITEGEAAKTCKHMSKHTKHNTQYTQHTTHNTQHTTHNTQYTTHNTQYIQHRGMYAPSCGPS